MSFLSRLAAPISAALLACAAPVDAAESQATGSGATFPAPAYAQWAKLFAAGGGARVAYEPTGSGEGVKAVETGSATFGASDVPLEQKDLQRYALVQFPTLIGGVLPIVRIPGVGPGDLVIDGQTLADLYMGGIAFWDDPKLLHLNPHLPLPHLAVLPVRRSDRSGTTAVFLDYLGRASKGWEEPLGRSPPELRASTLAAQGSAGVAEAVAAHPGAIGYVGFDYAQANRLTYVDLVNAEGRTVQPTLASIAAAAASADWSQGLTPGLLARPGGASWPIVSATYVLLHARNSVTAPVGAVLRFFDWAIVAGGPAAEDLGFVPLPERAAAAARSVLADVTDAAGNRLLAPPR